MLVKKNIDWPWNSLNIPLNVKLIRVVHHLLKQHSLNKSVLLKVPVLLFKITDVRVFRQGLEGVLMVRNIYHFVNFEVAISVICCEFAILAALFVLQEDSLDLRQRHEFDLFFHVDEPVGQVLVLVFASEDLLVLHSVDALLDGVVDLQLQIINEALVYFLEIEVAVANGYF